MGEAIPPRKPERECREYRQREIDYQTRPREIGKDPREVRNPNAPKKASEMTEQERILDLFA